MVNEEKRLLKVFLCHASGDKPPVRQLYKELVAEGVDAWLDQEKLLPGQDWRLEIPRAVQEADVVVVCLSNKSITREGYVQKEIRFALDVAEEKPEGTIFLIPARLEDCIVPERLSRWHWVDLYEENGFVKLLRSLKLRADKVGAVIEPVSYAISDKELQRRLDQLYTDGLAAFYTEDWDKACFHFQKIISERPNHRNATEKLAEAECQRKLAKLYAQSTEAIQSENWLIAIETLEELLQKAAEYKDAVQMLREARKKAQLHELYAEARALYAAQKWQAVVRVFKQISVIEPNFLDTDGLLVLAEREVAEAERLAELNEQYGGALREMDSGNWYEARRLLEKVHKSEMGFLETEKLLRKVENEILKEEENRKRGEQIDTLYEQAHGLLRSKKWRRALDKLEEIRALDEQFPDTEGIAEKAQNELEREEQEAERQNKLAALYAESVRSVREAKYQEALQKLEEIKSIDPKYPDRQGVEKIARKKLTLDSGMLQRRIRLPSNERKFLAIASIIALVLLGFVGWLIFMNQPATLPKCTYVKGIDDPLLLQSKFRSVPIFVDGKITYPTEWKNASCYQFNLMHWEAGSGCTGSFSVTSTWLITNDGKRLYILARIPKKFFTPTGIGLAYFYPYPYSAGWQKSDSMGIDQGQAVDQFGWDDVNWRDDLSDSGTMDTSVKAWQKDNYYWYEFSKPLDSGDEHDWKWIAGNKVGTGISGDLMLGTWGKPTTAWQTDYVCRHIQLKLEE